MKSAQEYRELAERLREPVSHTTCDDDWYSCPMSPEGCGDERRGTDCDCGADAENALHVAAATVLESIATALALARAQAVQIYTLKGNLSDQRIQREAAEEKWRALAAYKGLNHADPMADIANTERKRAETVEAALEKERARADRAMELLREARTKISSDAWPIFHTKLATFFGIPL